MVGLARWLQSCMAKIHGHTYSVHEGKKKLCYSDFCVALGFIGVSRLASSMFTFFLKDT